MTLQKVSLKNFIGNNKVVEEVVIELEGARRREAKFEHVLMTGPSGSGKTRLVNSIANELDCRFINLNSPQIKDWEEDVMSKLTLYRLAGCNTVSYARPTIIFFDEAHEIKEKIQMLLLKVISEGCYELSPESMIDLNKVTFAFATTNAEGLFTPLRMRCPIQLHLRKYTEEELAEIISETEVEDGGVHHTIKVHPDLAMMVAERARLTPRIAIRFMQRIHNYVRSRTADEQGAIDAMTGEDGVLYAEKYFRMKEIDELGLGIQDREYLDILGGAKGAKGVAMLAAQMEVSDKVLKDDIEPYLRHLKLIEFAPKGRAITARGREILRCFDEGTSTSSVLVKEIPEAESNLKDSLPNNITQMWGT
jgi:Holliday junction DNA helicase RuvB